MFLRLFPVQFMKVLRRRFRHPIARRPSACVRRRRVHPHRPSRLVRDKLLGRRVRLIEEFTIQRRSPITDNRYEVRPRAVASGVDLDGLLRQLTIARVGVTANGRHVRQVQHLTRSLLVRQGLGQGRILEWFLSPHPPRRQGQYRCLTQEYVSQWASTLPSNVRWGPLFAHRPFSYQRHSDDVIVPTTDLGWPDYSSAQSRANACEVEHAGPIYQVNVDCLIGATGRIEQRQRWFLRVLLFFPTGMLLSPFATWGLVWFLLSRTISFGLLCPPL